MKPDTIVYRKVSADTKALTAKITQGVDVVIKRVKSIKPTGDRQDASTDQ